MAFKDFDELSIQEIHLWCVSTFGSDKFYNLGKKMFIIENARFTENQKLNLMCNGHFGWTCVNGICTGIIDGIPFELNPRSTLIILHNKEVKIEMASSDFLFHATYMTHEFAQTMHIQNQFSVMMNIMDVPVYRLSEKQFSINMKYLDLMIEAIHDENNSYREQILYRLQEAQFFTILLHLQQNKKEQNTKISKTENIATNFNSLLESEYANHHDVGFYANRLCVTPKNLSENIKKISGLTAGQWIDKKIITTAKRLLGYSNLSVKDISYTLGFEDPSAFGKFFKRQVGSSPKNFRNRQK